MEFHELFGFLTIVSESIKLLPKNGKLMGIIVAFTCVLSSTLFLLANYSLQSLLFHQSLYFQQSFMPGPSSFDAPNPNSVSDPNTFTGPSGFDPAQITKLLDIMKEYVALIFGVLIAYFLALLVISFFAALATVLVSSVSYSAKTLSLKDLFLRAVKTWVGPMITTFYCSCLAIGYSSFVVMVVTPLVVYPNSIAYWVAVLLGVVGTVLNLYLCVAWGVAIVVSVVEESCYGLEALGKASVLVKGKRLHGFLLNICFNILVLILYMVYKILLLNKGFTNATLSGLFLVNVCFLAKIFLVMTYTVLYFECKKHHGEEIELNGHVEYMKLPITQS